MRATWTVFFIARMFISIFYTPANIYSLKYSLAQDCFNVPASTFFVYSLLSSVIAITIHVVVKKRIQSRDTHSATITSAWTIRETHENITLELIHGFRWIRSPNSRMYECAIHHGRSIRLWRFWSSINLVRRNVCINYKKKKKKRCFARTVSYNSKSQTFLENCPFPLIMICNLN